MSRSIVYASFAAALLMTSAALAQAPAGAPAGSTGACKDGSYTTAASKKGACRGHKGVQDWYAAAGSSSSAASSAGAPSTDSTATTGKKRRGHKSDAADAATATVAAPAAAAAAGAPPAGATGQCNDGSYSTGASKRGACRGHKGVKDWYAAVKPVAAKSAAPTAVTTATAAAPTAAAPTAYASKTRSTRSISVPSATAAPGGGPGLVWANKESKVYHCQDDRWYGKTKQGAYLSESDAKAQGYRPDHGKGCQG